MSSSHDQADDTADVLAIMKVMSILAQAQDDRDAVKYRAVLADEILIDLPMIKGFVPNVVKADDWVANATSGANASFYVTQHRLFNHVINVDGDDGTCDVDLSVTHQDFEKDGVINTWVIGGRYYIKLRRIDGEWKICARKLEYRYHTGTPPQHAKSWTWDVGQRRIEAHKATLAS